MKNFNNPNFTPGNLEFQHLVLQVKEKLHPFKSTVAQILKYGITNESPELVLSTIKDMAEDNYPAISQLISTELTDKILAL